MNFDLDDDERALQETVRDLCEGRLSSDRRRAAADTGGVDRALVKELADTGVMALQVPDDAGGLGLGATHAAVVFEELGRALVPGPLVATHLAAEHVPGAAEGTRIVAEGERDQRTVDHLEAADTVVVVDDDGLWQLEPQAVPGVAVDRPLDPLTPIHEVADWPRGERLAAAEAAATWRRRRIALTSALLLGNALATTDAMTAYAKERRQFGRTIGSFQAIKHLCADALTRAEVARAAVYAAACHLDDPDLGDVDVALSGAAYLAAKAAVSNAKANIQVHGGMGFTWEVDAHLYLKRAVVWSQQLGGTHRHAEQVAAAL